MIRVYDRLTGQIIDLSPDRFGEGFYLGSAGMVCPHTNLPLHYIRVKRPPTWGFDNRVVMMILSEELEGCGRVPYNGLIVYDRHILGPKHVRVVVFYNHYGRFLPELDMSQYFLKYPDLTHSSEVSEPCAV